MLSYMVPSIEEKPPPVPNKNHLQLDLENAGLPPVATLTNGHTSNKRPVKNSNIPTLGGKTVKSSIETSNNMIVTTSAIPTDSGNTVIKNTSITEDGNKITKTTTITTDGGHKVIKTSTVVTTDGSNNRVIKSTLSTESSASSLSSTLGEVPATHTSALTPNVDKPKPKLLTNGATKHQTLKRYVRLRKCYNYCTEVHTISGELST